jgi:protein-disulfide isomerase
MIPRKHLPVVIAICISAIIITLSFFIVNRGDGDDELITQENNTALLSSIPAISRDDHVMGNPNADIMLYVYSDFGCPHCKDYHETMHTLMNLYAGDGRVAWVFRHMPLVQLHPNAPMYAHASECVAEAGGAASFWEFADAMYVLSDPLSPVDAAQLVLLAEEVGVPRNSFVACMQSNRHMEHIEKEFQDAIDAGADGTPFTVITLVDQKIALEGAQQFKTLAASIQTTLRTLDAINSGKVEPPTSDVTTTPFSEQFKQLDTATSATTSSTTSTSTPSILDGIVDA